MGILNRPVVSASLHIQRMQTLNSNFALSRADAKKSNGIFNKAVTSPSESGFHFFGERKECLVFGQERRGVSTKR